MKLLVLASRPTKRPRCAGPFVGLPERIRTFDLQSRSLTRYPAVPRVDMKFLPHHYSILTGKKQPLFEKKSPSETPFRSPFFARKYRFAGDLPLWKTTLSPVDFSTTIRKSFPQPVENSVDISAIFWNFPHKIRHFGCFSRLKSNLGSVDNYQMGIFGDWSFPQGRGAKQRNFRRFFR